ncbi:MAG: efflux RND transporter permease subunit [Spongiibacter marinus]|uniref:efflux RND transporter permease subunit n=1 Tax=Spongiibacter TaxID=630749 RepID=UPI000C09824C|nr:MMPL family transporter [Spongiibacter sp.]MAK43498.1 RND transporter [Spongiibacter sp.]
MNNIRGRIAMAVLEHRIIASILFLAITLFFAAGLKNVRLETIFSDLLPKDDPFIHVFKDHPNFGNPLTFTLMVKNKNGDIYNAETLSKVWDLTRDIDLSPGVDHDQILSIASAKARYAEATPFGIDAQPLMGDSVPATPEEVQQFKDNVRKSPNARRFLISEDETATLVTATFIEQRLDYGEAFAFVKKLADDATDANHDVYMAGQPALTGWVYEYQHQMIGIFAITLSALVIALVLYTQNMAGVVTPIFASIVAAIWGFGFAGWMKMPIEPLLMIVPLLLIARSFSHCVQFTERFYEIFDQLGDKVKAAGLTTSVMMAPSILGIITDAAGIFLISIAPIPAMERFALFCGFWAMMLAPTGVFLAPLLLSVLPEPRNLKKIVSDHSGGFHGKVKAALASISRLSQGRIAPYTMIVVIAVGVFSLYHSMRIQIGNPVEGSNLLWEDSEYNVSVAQINNHFPGVNTLEVILEAKGDSGSDRVAKQADAVATMLQLQSIMESGEHAPRATLSFADYLMDANRLISGGHSKWLPLDNNDRAVNAAASAVLMGTSPKAFSNVVDFELQNSTVSFWYADNKQDTVDNALAAARAAVEQVGADHDAFTVRLGSGTIAIQQAINHVVERYHWLIMGLLNLVILAVSSYAYHSVVAGVVLLIPVNLSNMILTTSMSFMGIGLDINSLMVAAIGVGVGIDYGIYLLSRICEEYHECEDYGVAITSALTTTGKAIMFTASIMLLGILPWYFLSGLKFLADMGLLLVLVMLINMVIALVVLPLLVWVMKPKFVSSKDILVLGEGMDISKLLEEDERAAVQQRAAIRAEAVS